MTWAVLVSCWLWRSTTVWCRICEPTSFLIFSRRSFSISECMLDKSLFIACIMIKLLFRLNRLEMINLKRCEKTKHKPTYNDSESEARWSSYRRACHTDLNSWFKVKLMQRWCTSHLMIKTIFKWSVQLGIIRPLERSNWRFGLQLFQWSAEQRLRRRWDRKDFFHSVGIAILNWSQGVKRCIRTSEETLITIKYLIRNRKFIAIGRSIGIHFRDAAGSAWQRPKTLVLWDGMRIMLVLLKWIAV